MSLSKPEVRRGNKKPGERKIIKALLKELVKKHEERLESWERRSQLALAAQSKDGGDDGKAKRPCQLIVGMKTGCDVSSVVGEGDEEEAYILELPAEVLEVIFAKLDKLEDFKSCLDCCTKFRKILEPMRISRFLPEVLSKVMRFLDQSSFLSCREVCSHWRNTVDNLIVEILHNSNGKLPSNNVAVQIRKFGGYVIDLKDKTGELDQFLDDMDHNRFKNPFISKTTAISNNGRTPEGNYWEKIGRVLNRFGSFVWDCNIYIKGGNNDESEPVEVEAAKSKEIDFVMRIRESLAQMPNLQAFDISYSGTPYYQFNEQELIEVMQKFPPESFRPLTSLTKVGFVYAPRLFYDVMPIHFWNQIQSLMLSDFELTLILRAVGRYESVALLFPNLTQILLLDVGRVWTDLQHLELLRSPLDMIVVKPCLNPNIDLASFLSVINRFGSTLRCVDISWEGDGVPKPGLLSSRYLERCLSLSAPQLAAVHLKNPTESLNFLVCLPWLHYLSIRFEDDTCVPGLFAVKRQNEILEIHGFLHRMYTSNIWRKLPLLKTFMFIGSPADYWYSRNGYENYTPYDKMMKMQLTDKI